MRNRGFNSPYFFRIVLKKTIDNMYIHMLVLRQDMTSEARKEIEMKLMKKAERQITVWSMINTWKAVGCEVKGLGRYKKWKELDDGKLGLHMDIYKVVDPFGNTGYTMSDTLGRICCQTQTDKAEIMNWLADHGWKPEKQWYLEDYGMDEETWEEWNRG